MSRPRSLQKFPVYAKGKVIGYESIGSSGRVLDTSEADKPFPKPSARAVTLARFGGGVAGKAFGSATGVPGGAVVGKIIGEEMGEKIVSDPTFVNAVNPMAGSLLAKANMRDAADAAANEPKVSRELKFVGEPEFSKLTFDERKTAVKLPSELSVTEEDKKVFLAIEGRPFVEDNEMDKCNMVMLQNNFDLLNEAEFKALEQKNLFANLDVKNVPVDKLEVSGDDLTAYRDVVGEFDPRSDFDRYNMERLQSGMDIVAIEDWAQNPVRSLVPSEEIAGAAEAAEITVESEKLSVDAEEAGNKSKDPNKFSRVLEETMDTGIDMF